MVGNLHQCQVWFSQRHFVEKQLLLDGQFYKPYPVAHVKFGRVQVPGWLNQGLSIVFNLFSNFKWIRSNDCICSVLHNARVFKWSNLQIFPGKFTNPIQLPTLNFVACKFQPNSTPDNNFRTDQPTKEPTLNPKPAVMQVSV